MEVLSSTRRSIYPHYSYSASGMCRVAPEDLSFHIRNTRASPCTTRIPQLPQLPLPPSPHRCLYLRTGHPTTVHAHASYPHQVEHGSTTHVDRGCSIPLHAVFMLEDSTEGGISTSSAPPLSPTPSANTCIPYHTFVAVHALLFWTSSQNVGPY